MTSTETTTQGDHLATAINEKGINPQIELLQKPNFTQKWYAYDLKSVRALLCPPGCARKGFRLQGEAFRVSTHKKEKPSKKRHKAIRRHQH